MEKEKISLVLGSGGARGYAHIGVIETLVEQGYEIVAISGSSIGALVGGFYACGKLEVFKQWVLSLDLMDAPGLLDFSVSSPGIIPGEKIMAVFEEMIGDVKIEDLPVKYTAVATDIMAQEEVWLQSGSLLDAMRASIAIPTVFIPKKIGDRYLVDGGILNPLPVSVAMSDDSAVVVAVKLNAHIDKEYSIDIPAETWEQEEGLKKIFFELREKALDLMSRKAENTIEEMSPFDVVGYTIDTMQDALSDCKTAGYSPDIMINIPKKASGFYEFHKGYELIELGRIIAKETLASRRDFEV